MIKEGQLVSFEGQQFFVESVEYFPTQYVYEKPKVKVLVLKGVYDETT